MDKRKIMAESPNIHWETCARLFRLFQDSSEQPDQFLDNRGPLITVPGSGTSEIWVHAATASMRLPPIDQITGPLDQLWPAFDALQTIGLPASKIFVHPEARRFAYGEAIRMAQPYDDFQTKLWGAEICTDDRLARNEFALYAESTHRVRTVLGTVTWE